MTGFDAGWLDLREPADHAARSSKVLDAVTAAFASREAVSVADLAAGSGSTLRALAPRLGSRQRWMLIDHDEALLAHARTRLCDWADSAEPRGASLVLRRGPAIIEVMTVAADLSRDPLPGEAVAADLVTASALFDLVSRDWLNCLAARLSAAGRPLYAALIIDGGRAFDPPHRLDRTFLAAFERHMLADKGFGPALGPAAPTVLAARLSEAGYDLVEGDSAWRLAGDPALGVALVEGMARAIAEGADAPEGLDDWLAFRIGAFENGGRADVGHRDLFAVPRRDVTSSAPAPRRA